MLTRRISYEEMAERLGVSRRQILKDVKVIMAKWAEEQAPEDRHRWRLQELQTLAAMESAIADVVYNEEDEEGVKPYAVGLQVKAVRTALSILERRAELLGLDLGTADKLNQRPVLGKVTIHVHDDRPKQLSPPKEEPVTDFIDAPSWEVYEEAESVDGTA